PIRRNAGRVVDERHFMRVSFSNLNPPLHAADRIKILSEFRAVALRKCALEMRDLVTYRVEDALLLTHQTQPLFSAGAAAVAKQAFEHKARIVLCRKGCAGALPADGVCVRA